MNKIGLYIVTIVSLLLVSCSHVLYEMRDPAVRIALCIESGSTSLFHSETKEKVEIECDSGLSGDYVVIFHPTRQYSNEELLGKGLSVETIRKLRLRYHSDLPHGILYVIPLFSQDAGSHSAAYGRYVTIDNWLSVNKKDNLVYIELTKQDVGSVIITNVR